MKKVLIISPYFPPTNAADMQRIRMSLPYFKDFGWEAHVVTIDPVYSEMAKDSLLLESIPKDVNVNYVKALPKRLTAKVGLGSIAMRSLLYYKQKVDEILKNNRFDLIYFSTTQYMVAVLGPYWKKKFNIPFVVDMQDPWHSDYYISKPKNQRPPKYWFVYRLGKYSEPITMKAVDGLISVSEAYINTLRSRYNHCRSIPVKTITFGAFEKDLEIAQKNKDTQPSILTGKGNKIKIVYIGRGGHDMKDAVSCIFSIFKECLEKDPDIFSRFHFYFIGTSYAAAGKGVSTIQPIASSMKIDDHVTEITDRIPFYQSLNTLASADALFIPGSNDPQYTASKIYPYVMVKKPLLAIFHPESSAVEFLRKSKAGMVITFNQERKEMNDAVTTFFYQVANNEYPEPNPDPEVLKAYSAKTMTQKQCELFNEVVK